MTGDWYELRGTISSAGFASGDRFVVGHWRRSPIGPFADVMWAGPGGERRLLASSPRAAAFVSAVYRFDRVDVVAFRVTADPRTLDVDAGPVELHLRAGAGWRLPLARPAWFTRAVEAPIAHRLLGVSTYGVSPTGVEEWYRALGYRRVRTARALVDGRDLGPLAAVIQPPAGFGFSEPPRRPSMVEVHPRLRDPGGRLAQLTPPLQARQPWWRKLAG